MKVSALTPRFVEYIPERIEEGVLYVSERYGTAVHRCCCGCGREVVTPLSPAGWSVRRNGGLVSLWPSVGNWNFPCRSHYVIRDNRVLEARAMSERQIRAVQTRDRADLAAQVARANRRKIGTSAQPPRQEARSGHTEGLLQRVLRWWRG